MSCNDAKLEAKVQEISCVAEDGAPGRNIESCTTGQDPHYRLLRQALCYLLQACPPGGSLRTWGTSLVMVALLGTAFFRRCHLEPASGLTLRTC